MKPEKKVEILEKICKKYFSLKYSLIKDVTVHFNTNEEFLPDYTITFKIDKKQLLDLNSNFEDKEDEKTLKFIMKKYKKPFTIGKVSNFKPLDEIEVQTYKLADSIGIDGEFVFVQIQLV